MTSAGLAFFGSDCAKRIDSGPSDEHFHYCAELLALHEQFFGSSCPDVIKKAANVFITIYGKNPKYSDDPKMALVYYLLGRYSKTMSVNTVMKTLYDNNRFLKLAVFYELWMGGLVDEGKRKEAAEVLSLARKNAAQPARLIEKLDQQLKQLTPVITAPFEKNTTESKTPTNVQKRRPSLLTASVRKSLSTPPAAYATDLKTPKGTPRNFTSQTPKTTEVTSQQKKRNNLQFDKSEAEDEVAVVVAPLLPDNMHVKLEPTILPETTQFQFHRVRPSSSSLEITTVYDNTQVPSPLMDVEEKENSSEEVFQEVKNNSFDFLKFIDDPTNRRLSTFEKRRKSKKGGTSFVEQSTFVKTVTGIAIERELQNAIDSLSIETMPFSQNEPKRNPFKL